MKSNLSDLTMEEMKELAASMGEKAFRGKQLFQWIHGGAASYEEMTNLPKSFRVHLAQNYRIGTLPVLDVKTDPADGTSKFLFGLQDPAAEGDDGAAAYAVESVFMRYSYGNTICVSSQVGCRMGCSFCASALGGFLRNLSPGEMLQQVLSCQRQTGEEVNHVVVMGMGEPFDNYENVSRFLQLLHAPEGKHMSYRHMTVSTSGLIPGIRRFAEDFPQAGLAISLHRIDDAGRSRIMPVNRRYPLPQLLQAAEEYTRSTGRRITFEYTLIRGENDGAADVQGLIRALSGMLCHVNLIPLNAVAETGLAGSSRRRAYEMAEQLEAAGVPATVRRELGTQIDGACGQLRLRHKKT